MFIVWILLIAVVVVVALASQKPDWMRIERSMVMNAPASRIFEHVNNLHKWESWSPWAKMDPNAKAEFAGPEEGVGARMSWDGTMQVGKGTMEIVESVPAERITLQLVFEKPMKGTSKAYFMFLPEGAGTKVVWGMEGRSGFMGKVMSVFINCEKMMNQQYDKGLANLKAVVEA